jgi:hypothetical protein
MQPVWVHIPSVGWVEAMMNEEGALRFQEEPQVSPGMRIMTVARIEGEGPPDAEETALMLTQVVSHYQED